ncbi:hypothetical protein EMCRGX_G008054 [Ephydatia muelleri]
MIQNSTLKFHWDFQNISSRLTFFQVEYDCSNPHAPTDGYNSWTTKDLVSTFELIPISKVTNGTYCEVCITELNVLSTKVTFSYGDYCTNVKYSISSDWQNVVIQSDNVACFSCILPGHNKSDIWQVNDKNAAQNITAEGSLIVTNPLEVFGDSIMTSKLTCGNSESNTSITAFVMFAAPPDAVNILNITTTLVSLNHIRINWTAPASNNAPITSYNVTYCIADPITMNAIGSEISAVVTTTSVDFAPMTLNRMYRVSFVATNSAGRSPPTYYFMNATTSNDATPVNFTVASVSTDAVIVTWTLSPLNTFTSADPFRVQLDYFTLCVSHAGSAAHGGQCWDIAFDPDQYRVNQTINATVSLTGVTASPSEQYQLTLNLTAYYSNPFGRSSAAVISANVTAQIATQAITSVTKDALIKTLPPLFSFLLIATACLCIGLLLLRAVIKRSKQARKRDISQLTIMLVPHAPLVKAVSMTSITTHLDKLEPSTLANCEHIEEKYPPQCDGNPSDTANQNLTIIPTISFAKCVSSYVGIGDVGNIVFQTEPVDSPCPTILESSLQSNALSTVILQDSSVESVEFNRSLTNVGMRYHDSDHVATQQHTNMSRDMSSGTEDEANAIDCTTFDKEHCSDYKDTANESLTTLPTSSFVNCVSGYVGSTDIGNTVFLARGHLNKDPADSHFSTILESHLQSSALSTVILQGSSATESGEVCNSLNNDEITSHCDSDHLTTYIVDMSRATFTAGSEGEVNMLDFTNFGKGHCSGYITDPSKQHFSDHTDDFKQHSSEHIDHCEPDQVDNILTAYIDHFR